MTAVNRVQVVSIRQLLVMADKGWSGAFEEIVIRLSSKISKTGKALEASESSDQ